MRRYFLSENRKTGFDLEYPVTLSFLKKYFWIYYCTVFVILTVFSHLFAMEVKPDASALLFSLPVVPIAVFLGILLQRCQSTSNRILYFLAAVAAVFQLIFHVPESLLAFAITLFLDSMLLFPRFFIFMPLVTAFGCLFSIYFAYCFITVTLLCVYMTRTVRTERENKACLYTFCLSAVIVSAIQIVLYGGFLSFNMDYSGNNLLYLALAITAISTMICFYDEKQKRIICIVLNVFLILWCILWPELLILAISASFVFYNCYIDSFLQKTWRVLTQKTGPCLLCFSAFVCVIKISGFHLPKTYYAIYTYYLNYFDMGFVRRSLIGTVVYLLFGFKIPINIMCLFIAALCYVEAGFIIFLFVLLIRKLHTDNALILAAFSTVLVVFVPSLLSSILIGHMENHLALILLLSLVCIFKGGKAIWFAIPLCAIGVCIHTAFIFYCFPLVFLAVFYDSFFQTEKPQRFRLLLLGGLIVVTCGLFVYMTYYSYAVSMLPSKMATQYLTERSGELPNNSVAVKVIFEDVINANPSKHLRFANGRLGMDVQLRNIVRMRYFIPHLLLYFIAFWLSAGQKNSRWKKWVVRVAPFCLITFLPLYLFETDHGRWNTMFVLWLCVGVIEIAVLQGKDYWYQKIPKGLSGVLALIMVVTAVRAGLFQIFI